MRASRTAAARRRVWVLPVAGAAVLALAVLAAGTAHAPVRRSADGAGIGAARRLPSLGPDARAGRPIRRLRCTAARAPATAAHVELFALGHVVIVAAGIGVAPPRRRAGAYVTGGRCRYPIWTSEPTGVVRIAAPGLKLGDLFAIWGQPLSRRRLGRWRAPVRADVGGARWRGDPAAIPLLRHAQIVVQAGRPFMQPQAHYRFAQGL